MKIGTLVAVEWDDAWFDSQELMPADFKDSAPTTTIGILLRQGAVVTVAGEDLHDGRYRSVTHIPAGMVRRVRRIGG